MKPFSPSNSDDGFVFIAKFCEHCAHGKAEHDLDAPGCEVLCKSLFSQAEEWVYDDEGKPTCLAFRRWEWVQDENGQWNDPPPPPDPNQLSLFH